MVRRTDGLALSIEVSWLTRFISGCVNLNEAFLKHFKLGDSEVFEKGLDSWAEYLVDFEDHVVALNAYFVFRVFES